MTPARLTQLLELSQAKQDADAAKLQVIRAEEARIRAQLAALDDRHTATRGLPAIETMPHRRLGGDILWQVWVGRRRRALQIQLARCLAHQGSARSALGRSFGKRSALQSVQTDLQTERDQHKKIKALDAITDLGILKEGSTVTTR